MGRGGGGGQGVGGGGAPELPDVRPRGTGGWYGDVLGWGGWVGGGRAWALSKL